MTSSPESQGPGASAAARWFDVRLEHDQLSRSGFFRRAARWVITEASPLSWVFADMAPKVEAKVVVFRRADGISVKEFDDYDSEYWAANHLANLQDRLTRTQVFDFCRELGIDINQVRE